MKRQILVIASLLSFSSFPSFAADDYQPGPDSLPQPGIPKGAMLKDKYTAAEYSVFPGTEREYQIYLPAGLDTSKPAPFMVFQDGVIYQAPVVFDNLIAKNEIPPLIGIFIKPGVVPAANDNALPRFNRSYEYDSVTDSYSRFLIDEFLPAIAAKHKLNLSTDPNARGIAGSSSGGICAFMVAWHRPDSFRRVFTSVGTYVGIHGADQLPVLVRKYEPKPIRIYLQSGENDNNLYCGDWWMANQMMERSLTWNGYDVNHTWGTGGHNQKHATAIFPDVLRWLWKGYPDEPVKANPRGDAKWRGYEVIGEGEWKVAASGIDDQFTFARSIIPSADGSIYFGPMDAHAREVSRRDKTNPTAAGIPLLNDTMGKIAPDGHLTEIKFERYLYAFAVGPNNSWVVSEETEDGRSSVINHILGGAKKSIGIDDTALRIATSYAGDVISYGGDIYRWSLERKVSPKLWFPRGYFRSGGVCFTPDQTSIYVSDSESCAVYSVQVLPSGGFGVGQKFCRLEVDYSRRPEAGGLCVDTNGWLYVATSLGIQVLDQAGRVNFIIPTPKQPSDVCFGGKDLSELFIACGDRIYKRPTKAHGYISGQMAPIKPPPPKL